MVATLCACAGYVAGPTSRQVISHDYGAWCVYLACHKGPCHGMWVFSGFSRRPRTSPARSLAERLVVLLSGAHTARGGRGTGARCCSALRGPGGIRTGWLGGRPARRAPPFLFLSPHPPRDRSILRFGPYCLTYLCMHVTPRLAGLRRARPLARRGRQVWRPSAVMAVPGR